MSYSTQNSENNKNVAHFDHCAACSLVWLSSRRLLGANHAVAYIGKIVLYGWQSVYGFIATIITSIVVQKLS